MLEAWNNILAVKSAQPAHDASTWKAMFSHFLSLTPELRVDGGGAGADEKVMRRTNAGQSPILAIGKLRRIGRHDRIASDDRMHAECDARSREERGKVNLHMALTDLTHKLNTDPYIRPIF